MTDSFRFHLPSWPPSRLLQEATASWNLRHMDDEELLNPEKSPWPLIRGSILAWLRHAHSNFDDLLRNGKYDETLRDSLAAEIARSAFLKYPWLGKDDPRPFAEQEEDAAPIFTVLARDLAYDHSVKNHLVSAIRDLKRQGKLEQVETLQNALAKVENRIKRSYALLAGPKYSYDEGGSSSRTFSIPHEADEREYHFLDGRAVTSNRYHFLGFRCAVCDAPVVQLKQKANFGQGFVMQVSSCFCRTLATVCPPAGRRLTPLTPALWQTFNENES
jgi:hypothetical protein